MFPGFDRVYSLNDDVSRRAFRAVLEGRPPHRELLRGEWVPEATLQAHWCMGEAEPQDIAWSRTVAWYYLSPRVLELFRDNELTGWSTYPIVLHNKAGKLCPGYAGLTITGRCGPIDKQRGELVPGQNPNKKFPRHIGLYFDEATWDGSDIFCPEGKNTYKFATQRVKDLCDKHEIRGFRFTPLTQTTWYP